MSAVRKMPLLHLVDLQKITVPAQRRGRTCILMGSSAAQDSMYLCASASPAFTCTPTDDLRAASCRRASPAAR